MSKKPTLTIRYPEASEKALKLTEAMVKRSPGKRVVETESEDPIFPDGGDLFSSFIRCKTQTGVDLTLTLNPASMDFALETLIRPNLNADERKQILGEDVEQDQAELGLGDGAQAAQAPGQDTSCTTEVRSAPLADGENATQSGEPKKQIEIGKLTDVDLRDILRSLIDTLGGTAYSEEVVTSAIDQTIWEIKKIADEVPAEQIKLADPQITQKMAAALYAAGCSKKSKLLDPFVRGLLADIEIKDNEDEYYISLSALIAIKKKMEEWKINDPFALYDQFQGSIPSWDDVEKEARTIRKKSDPASEPDGEEPSAPAEKSAAPLADGDIEPGLLNDIEDNGEGGEE